MQAGVGFAAALTYLLMHVGMPDTSHPGTRGIDKEFGGTFKWVWLNPFKCLRYMRSPNLFAMVSQLLPRPRTAVCCAVGDIGLTSYQAFVAATALLADFGMRVSMRWRYGVILTVNYSSAPPDFHHPCTSLPRQSTNPYRSHFHGTGLRLRILGRAI